MGDIDDGGLVQQLQEELLHLVLPGTVQTAGGLVQDQYPSGVMSEVMETVCATLVD